MPQSVMGLQMQDWIDSAPEQELLLNLTQVRGIGAARIRALVANFGAPTAICRVDARELSKLPGIDEATAAAIKSAAFFDFGRKQLEKLFESDFRLLSYWHPNYPSLLRQIPDPPLILFVWGEVSYLDCFGIAIVGTRHASSYGRQVTEKLAAELVEERITIVSGLARGIDTIAHLEAVKRGGPTLAVLGSGLDVVYPSENIKLARKIAECGAVVSEMPFGAAPDAVNFPRRNRLISGLSLGTIVVEARQRSGALITAYHALEQNREVFAVPGSIFSARSQGPHSLIRDGAKIVHSIADVLDELPRQRELFARQEYLKTVPPDLSDQEQKIVEGLSGSPIHVDHLAQKVGMTSQGLLALLLQLEFRGLVKQLPGKMFVRS